MDDLAHVLGIEPRRQRGRADEIAEHDGELAPLGGVGVGAGRRGGRDVQRLDSRRRTDGATIVDLTQATGWLAHTTRAAITGLRKRGYAVTRARSEAGESVYRISGAPDGSEDRVAVQTAAVHGRRAPKPRTKRAA